MKPTGIVMRIDDLGRVIIPKAIRRDLGIKDGDLMEIFTSEGGQIIFKPCQPTRVIDNFIEEFKGMNTIDKKEIVKMLIEEIN